MSAPSMAGWNLALRFGLELAALAGLAIGAWTLASDGSRWIAVVALPLAAAVIWGTFNVLDDPSRSGAAPVEVAGWTRLAIELLILGGGAAAVAIAGRPNVAIVLVLLVALQSITSWSRIEWLAAA